MLGSKLWLPTWSDCSTISCLNHFNSCSFLPTNMNFQFSGLFEADNLLTQYFSLFRDDLAWRHGFICSCCCFTPLRSSFWQSCSSSFDVSSIFSIWCPIVSYLCCFMNRLFLTVSASMSSRYHHNAHCLFGSISTYSRTKPTPELISEFLSHFFDWRLMLFWHFEFRIVKTGYPTFRKYGNQSDMYCILRSILWIELMSMTDGPFCLSFDLGFERTSIFLISISCCLSK